MLIFYQLTNHIRRKNYVLIGIHFCFPNSIICITAS